MHLSFRSNIKAESNLTAVSAKMHMCKYFTPYAGIIRIRLLGSKFDYFLSACYTSSPVNTYYYIFKLNTKTRSCQCCLSLLNILYLLADLFHLRLDLQHIFRNVQIICLCSYSICLSVHLLHKEIELLACRSAGGENTVEL
jgi:hypothetical protein